MSWQQPNPQEQPSTVPGMSASALEARMHYDHTQNFDHQSQMAYYPHSSSVGQFYNYDQHPPQEQGAHGAQHFQQNHYVPAGMPVHKALPSNEKLNVNAAPFVVPQENKKEAMPVNRGGQRGKPRGRGSRGRGGYRHQDYDEYYQSSYGDQSQQYQRQQKSQYHDGEQGHRHRKPHYNEAEQGQYYDGNSQSNSSQRKQNQRNGNYQTDKSQNLSHKSKEIGNGDGNTDNSHQDNSGRGQVYSRGGGFKKASVKLQGDNYSDEKRDTASNGVRGDKKTTASYDYMNDLEKATAPQKYKDDSTNKSASNYRTEKKATASKDYNRDDRKGTTSAKQKYTPRSREDEYGNSSNFNHEKKYRNKVSSTDQARSFELGSDEDIRRNLRRTINAKTQSDDVRKQATKEISSGRTDDSKLQSRTKSRYDRDPMNSANGRYDNGRKGQLRNNGPQSGEFKDESLRGTLTEQLSKGKYECMICCDNVRMEASVWSCHQCYHIFHLACIKKWALSSMDRATKSWRCPGCQNDNDIFPSKYYCFCGGFKDPPYMRGETPHSCLETCHKKRKGSCKHSCTILCHPGPCPPCNAMVWQSCDCGQDKKHVRCAVAQEYKCDQACNKHLNCAEHVCQLVCHSDSCPPCSVAKQQSCFCKKVSRSVLCGTQEFEMESYSCEKVCGRSLICGNHVCEELCHPGDCAPCALAPGLLKTCCCGQTPVSQLEVGTRTSCLDPVPVCPNTCGKKLNCGQQGQRHRCELRCHQGECGACSKSTQLRCECGATEKAMPCEEAKAYDDFNPFKCQRRCGKKKVCGKHKCSDDCCVKDIHICEIVCAKFLSCGVHKCEELCHKGNCKRCLQAGFEELTCHCGYEILMPPVACGTKPPECRRTCIRIHSCPHPVRHNCNREESCPPCIELVERMCNGAHMMRKNVPCHIENVSCGYPCGKVLPCGQHKCQKTCHMGQCLEAGSSCTQPCSKAREACGHPCMVQCHTGVCPDTQCKAEMRISCPCGRRSAEVQCGIGGDMAAEIAQFQRVSIMAQSGGQGVDMAQFTQQKRKQRKLECDTTCAIRERNKRLALALEITNPDLDNKLGRPSFSDFLKDYAKKNSKFATDVEQKFCDLVQLAKQSPQASRTHSFPAMNRDQRHYVHELAENYGCQTVSYDYEPNKNVVATALKEKCWLPNVTLTLAVQKEQVSKGPPPISSLKTQGVKFTVLDKSKPSSKDGSAATKDAWGGWGATKDGAGAVPASNRGWEQKGPTPQAQATPMATPTKPRPPTSASSSSTKPAIDYFDFTD